jgi:hypothetical protein
VAISIHSKVRRIVEKFALLDPMRHKHPRHLRQIRIDVVGMGFPHLRHPSLKRVKWRKTSPNLSETLMKQRRFAEALTQIKRTLAVAPDDIAMMIAMGDCLNELGRTSESENFFRMAIKTGGPEHLPQLGSSGIIVGKTYGVFGPVISCSCSVKRCS